MSSNPPPPPGPRSVSLATLQWGGASGDGTKTKLALLAFSCDKFMRKNARHRIDAYYVLVVRVSLDALRVVPHSSAPN